LAFRISLTFQKVILHKVKEVARIEPAYASVPCSNLKCGYRASNNEDLECPGSEENEDHSIHHCADCGQLDIGEKGADCEKCGNHWCVSYQHLFVRLDDCEQWSFRTSGEEFICMNCFLAEREYWCTDPNCRCGCKQEKWEQIAEEHEKKKQARREQRARRPKRDASPKRK